MTEDIAKAGFLINYHCLPTNSNITLVLIRDQAEFNNILIEYNGDQIPDDTIKEEIRSIDMTELNISSQKLDKVILYSLSNGLIAVDNRSFSIANPFYLTKSIKDVLIVSNYLLIYYYDENPMVDCVIHGHSAIKKFLSSQNDFKLINEASDEGKKIYTTTEGKAILVHYTKDHKLPSIKSITKFLDTFLDKEGREDDELYFDLVICESLQKMYSVGVWFDDKEE